MLNFRNWMAAAATLAACAGAQADLHDRGNGLIYDDVQNITWLADWNYAKTSGADADGLMNWTEANTWVADLVYGGFNDWRLPDQLEKRDYETREFNRMFVVNFGLTTIGVDFPETVLANTANLALFKNIQPTSVYWTGGFNEAFEQPWAYETNPALGFGLGYWYSMKLPGTPAYAVAVRDGDVLAAVPEPATCASLLLGLAMLVLIFRRRPLRKTAAIALVAAAPAAWCSDVITDWSASSGPPNPAWQLSGTGASLGASALTISTASDPDNTYFLQDATVRPGFNTLAGASIETRLRWISGSTSNDARDAAFLAITQGDGWGNALFIGDGRIFIGSGTGSRGATAFIDTSLFHVYRIDLGASDGASSASFIVSVDGLALLTGNTYSSFSDNGTRQLVYWGEGSTLAHGTSEWEFVRDTVAVPEPQTWALSAAGLLAVMAIVARRRQQA